MRALFLMLLLGSGLVAGPVIAQNDPDPGPPFVVRSLLVWTAEEASSPGDLGADTPSGIALINSLGVMSPLMELPAGVTTVIPCGESATAPGRGAFVFYAGNPTVGTLYLVRGQETPVEIDEVQRNTCQGVGSFRFSPDGSRFAYLDYPTFSSPPTFLSATLKVYDVETANLSYESENATAFALDAGRVGVARFFTDGDGNADEAAVWLWDGTQDREVAILRPDGTDSGCAFVSASAAWLLEDQFSLLLGQLCTRTRQTSWQSYVISPADGSATLATAEDIIGAYLIFARTNAQFVAPGGAASVFTVPDGIVANTASLYALEQEALTTELLLERQVVMPANTTPANTTPRQSPDGRWLAFAETSPDNENALTVFDLSDLSLSPIRVSAGSTGDVVSALRFTDDSQRLYAVLGGTDQEDNGVVVVDLATGNDTRAARGQFTEYVALAENGLLGEGLMGLSDWQFPEDPTEEPYLNLVLLDAPSSATRVLYPGIVTEGDEIVARRFAVPLAWR